MSLCWGGQLFCGPFSALQKPAFLTSHLRQHFPHSDSPASGLWFGISPQPPPNCHLPHRVALLEDVNRMSPSALAIIFAPCLLRCPDNSDPLVSMKDVLKITT